MLNKKELIKSIIVNNQNIENKIIFHRSFAIPLKSNKIITIIGPRRSGKTYMMYQLMQELLKKGTSWQKLVYLNFEDERLDLESDELDFIIQAFLELYPKSKLNTCYFFLDEIQNCTGWEKFVRRIKDQYDIAIYLSGSNAKLLSKEIATSLRGRTISIEILPFSFQETILAKGINNNIYNTQNKALLINCFREYLQLGGYP